MGRYGLQMAFLVVWSYSTRLIMIILRIFFFHYKPFLTDYRLYLLYVIIKGFYWIFFTGEASIIHIIRRFWVPKGKCKGKFSLVYLTIFTRKENTRTFQWVFGSGRTRIDCGTQSKPRSTLTYFKPADEQRAR